MSWIFLLAYALLIGGVILLSLGIESGEGALFTGGFIFAAIGIAVYHWSVVAEVNCYRDGGEMVNMTCAVVQVVTA